MGTGPTLRANANARWESTNDGVANDMTAIDRCPICSTPVTPPKSFFPFCSDRCRMVDLGRWLTGHYAIPGESLTEEEKPPPEAEPELD